MQSEIMTTPAPAARAIDNRLFSLDFARGIAIIAMVVIHVITFMGDQSVTGSFARNIIASIVCSVAAPTFMFIMGIVLAFSSRRTIKGDLLRGVSIFGLAYLLNFLRGTLPVFVANVLKITSGGSPLSYLREIDILQFAGLALLLLAIVKHYLPWRWAGFGGGVLALIITPCIGKLDSVNQSAHYAITLFSGSAEYAFFPFFSWIVFPLFGMTYGRLLKGAQNKAVFFIRSAIIGSVVLALGIALGMVLKDNLLHRWFSGEFLQGKLPWSMVLVFTGIQCVWLASCFWIVGKIPANKALGRLYFWSRNITLFYCIQWTLIGWLCVFLPPANWGWVVVAIVVVTFLTDRSMLAFAKK